jgi:uncharacterized protein YeaC (DUF1315 family)
MAVVRRIISFDVPEGPIGPYDAAEGLAQLRKVEGVQSVALYETRDGKPAYMLDIQVERDALDKVEQALNRQMSANGDYLANVSRRTFSQLA